MSEDSIRSQYARYGAQGYYEQFGAHYRNPHELAVQRAIHAAVAAWELDLADERRGQGRRASVCASGGRHVRGDLPMLRYAL